MSDSIHRGDTADELDQLRHNLSRLSTADLPHHASGQSQAFNPNASQLGASGSMIDLGASASNSHAVASAFRALQDKIRRLETECSFYKDAYESTKRAAFDAREEAESRIARLQSSWNSEREVLTRERNDLIATANSLREQLRGFEKDAVFYKDMSRALESEKKTYQIRSDDLDAQLSAIQRTAAGSVGELQNRVSELTRNVEDRQHKIEDLQSAFDNEHSHRVDLETRNSKLETALTEIININEHLVDRLTSLEQQSQEAAKKKTVKKRGGAGSSSQASAASGSAASKKRPVSAVAARPPPPSLSSISTYLGNMHEKLRQANLDQDVPFLLGTNTGPSFHTTAVVQNAIDGHRIRNASPSPSPTPNRPRPESAQQQSADRKNNNGSFSSSQRRESLSGSGLNSSIIARQNKLANSAMGADVDIDEVISSLEQEYETLNREYSTLLRQTQEAASSFQASDLDLMSRLRNVIDLMERKGQQLRHLRSYRKTITSTLKEAISPPPFPGAEKRKRALDLYRNLKETSLE
eukprot:ANDGO_07096.mRNA.1 hypothetical protein SPRG_01742